MAIVWWSNAITYPGGAPATHEEVLVTLPDSATPATLYLDEDGNTEAPNPDSTDGLGNLSFFVEGGEYDLVVRGRRIRIFANSPDFPDTIPELTVSPKYVFLNALEV